MVLQFKMMTIKSTVFANQDILNQIWWEKGKELTWVFVCLFVRSIYLHNNIFILFVECSKDIRFNSTNVHILFSVNKSKRIKLPTLPFIRELDLAYLCALLMFSIYLPTISVLISELEDSNFISLFVSVLRIIPIAPCMLGKCSTCEIHPHYLLNHSTNIGRYLPYKLYLAYKY